MASIITLDTAEGTLTLNGRVFTDFPEGDAVSISFPNERTSQTQGTDGNTVAKKRTDADNGLLTINLLRNSADDAFLQNTLNGGLVVFNGSYKRNFTRDGIDGVESYSLDNGTMLSTGDQTYSNTDGEEISSFTINFATALRSN